MTTTPTPAACPTCGRPIDAPKQGRPSKHDERAALILATFPGRFVLADVAKIMPKSTAILTLKKMVEDGLLTCLLWKGCRAICIYEAKE